jgi:V/A-type H+-transporting ATPase subunit E
MEEGIERIKTKIQERSEKEREASLAGAKEEASKIVEDAKKSRETRKRDIVEIGERAAGLEKQRVIADAKMRARKLEWDVKEDVIREVIENVKEIIVEIRNGDESYGNYSTILKHLIKEAAISAGGKDLEVMLPEEDIDHISSADLDEISKEVGEISLSDERITSLGGPVVKTKDEKIVVNNTFDRRIETYSGVLRAEIAKELFGV